MNIPNLITLYRITTIPIFVGLVFYGKKEAAFFIFLSAGISDAIDGFLARILNQRTVLGTYLDPIADKALINLAFLSLTIKEFIPIWIAIIVLGRDFTIIIGFITLKAASFDIKVQPNLFGKATTLSEMLFILSSLSNFAPLSCLRKLLMIIMIILTCISGILYILKGTKIVEGGKTCQS